MSPIVPSRYGHPKYNVIPQKTRSASQGTFKATQRTISGSETKYSRRKQRIEESKITIQPADDDDHDNFFGKHLAAARFHRNHRLINVIFSDAVVDKDSISDNDKLQACRKRVKNLTDFQKKIDDEVGEINTKFLERKTKIIEEGKLFCTKLNEYIANSKRQIEAARVEKARLDLELQRSKPKVIISENETEGTGEAEPMDVSIEGVQDSTQEDKSIKYTSSEVQDCLDQLIKSVSDSI